MGTEEDTFDALKYPPTEDEIYFGRKKWIYCSQHRRPHLTGWCTVNNRDKTSLDAITESEAIYECKALGFRLLRD